MKLKALVSDLSKTLLLVEKKIAAKIVVISHLSYYGLVGLEAHGRYRYAALVIGGIMIIDLAKGKEVEHAG